MVRAIMHGCNGAMGQVISGLAENDEEISIVAGIDVNTAKQNPEAIIINPPTSHASSDNLKSPPDNARTPPAFKNTPEPITIPTTIAIPVHKPYCFFILFIMMQIKMQEIVYMA